MGDISVPIVSQVAETICRFDMLAPQDRVLVAVSGGPDSMALVHALIILAPGLKVDLAIAHLNHGIRPEAAQREEAFVRNAAKGYGLPYYTDRIHLDVRLGSLEERARTERYRFLTHTAKANGYTKIAVGHHADDNAEALLMHLLRGSGNRGLGAIPPVRDHWIVRPLIQVRRSRISTFLAQRNIAYVQDESNEDIRFIRNRIRHRLLPFLEKEFNPNIVETLNRTALLCREEEVWFGSFLKPMLENIRKVTKDDHLCLKTGPMLTAPPAIQRRLIRHALIQWQGHLQRLTAVHVEAVIDLLASMAADEFAGESTEKQLNLPDGIVALISKAHLLFFRQKTKECPGTNDNFYTYSIESKRHLPARISIKACKGELLFTLDQPPPQDRLTDRQTHCVWLDADGIRFPLTVRNVRPGDRLSPFGMNGTQKVKKLLNNAKVPLRARRNTPLLVSGNDVLWVAGIRRSDKAPVTKTTREVLRVQFTASHIGK